MADEDRHERIRERAHLLWIEEGKPQGREKDHWELASKLVAIEESQLSTLKPVEQGETGPTGEPVEPLLAVENEGEFPTLTDQGEARTAPMRRNSRPPNVAKKAAKRCGQ